MDKIPNWPTYFMSIAEVVSTRSKDPATKVGAVLVDTKNHIVGTGYNGMQKGMLETVGLWQRPTKYQWVIHAEENAINHSTNITAAATLYCTLFPCLKCMNKIIEDTSISLVYYKAEYRDSEHSLKLAKEHNIITAKLC